MTRRRKPYTVQRKRNPNWPDDDALTGWVLMTRSATRATAEHRAEQLAADYPDTSWRVRHAGQTIWQRDANAGPAPDPAPDTLRTHLRIMVEKSTLALERLDAGTDRRYVREAVAAAWKSAARAIDQLDEDDG